MEKELRGFFRAGGLSDVSKNVSAFWQSKMTTMVDPYPASFHSETGFYTSMCLNSGTLKENTRYGLYV